MKVESNRNISLSRNYLFLLLIKFDFICLQKLHPKDEVYTWNFYDVVQQAYQ